MITMDARNMGRKLRVRKNKKQGKTDTEPSAQSQGIKSILLESTQYKSLKWQISAYLDIKACVARFSRSGPDPEPPTEASAPAIFENET